MNETIVVTGAGGYLASHLIPELLNQNYRVYGIDNRAYSFPIDEDHADKLIFFNDKFGEAKKKIVQLLNKNDETVSSIIHFAGVSDANKCNKNSLVAYDANVNLTMEVLEFCREQNIQKFYFPSTGLVYGEKKNNQFSSEESLINPLNFYAWTKHIAEKTIESYCTSFSIQAIIMRFNNIIGYPLKKGTILSDIFSQIINGAKEVIINDGNPVRDFIFIKDAISAIILLLKMEISSDFGIYNVSSGIGIQTLELAHMACASNNLPASIVKSMKPREKNPLTLVLDNRKLKKAGWSPRYSIEESINQINRYMI